MDRIAPVDPFEHVAELRRGDHHCAVGRRRPNEAAAFQPFGVERHAQPIAPKDLYQLAALATE